MYAYVYIYTYEREKNTSITTTSTSTTTTTTRNKLLFLLYIFLVKISHAYIHLRMLRRLFVWVLPCVLKVKSKNTRFFFSLWFVFRHHTKEIRGDYAKKIYSWICLCTLPHCDLSLISCLSEQRTRLRVEKIFQCVANDFKWKHFTYIWK